MCEISTNGSNADLHSQSTDQQIQAHHNDKEVLKQHIETMNLLVKIFYDLSCQDLPPIFENKLQAVTALLHKYLTYENPLLITDDNSESGPLEFVKSGICEAMTLYMQRYEDVFGDLCQPFITSAWNLLTSIGPETKYDILVSKTLHFLTAVASIDKHAQNFNNEDVLGQVVEKVILPNIALRESDIEQFEDEPIEYIRRDLEGSDADTRRRAATDFLRKLLEKFEGLVTKVVDKYVTHYLSASSQKTSDDHWKSKDTAIYLFSAIAAKGVITAGHGVKTTNPLLNVVDFFQKNIANDLLSESESEPILKVDAIKFLYTFRSQLTVEQWRAAFPPLLKALGASNYVVYTYAAIAVERVLFLTDDAGQHVFGKDDVMPFAKDLLEHLFHLIERDSAPEKVQENEFIMRCVMRVLMVIKDGMVPMSDMVLQHLATITEIIGKNPSNPRFYYYHFEALGALIRYLTISHVHVERLLTIAGSPLRLGKTSLRANCTPLSPTSFSTISKVSLIAWYLLPLELTCPEFMPYTFQLLAALLEAHPQAPLKDHYKILFPPVLTPSLWDSKGNVPALARLLASMIPRQASDIVANKQVEPILGIFQKLIAGKAKTELHSFDVLESLITSVDV